MKAPLILVICGFLLCGIAGHAHAQSAPPVPPSVATSPGSTTEVGRSLDRLFTRLAVTGDAAEARRIAERIERRWQHSGSETADLLSHRAAGAVGQGDSALAVELLDRVIGLQPDWAEAYYQRALVFVVLDDHRRAVTDLGQVLRLEPRHYQAMMTLAGIMQKQDRKKAAFELYQLVLTLYPAHETARSLTEHLRADVRGQDL